MAGTDRIVRTAPATAAALVVAVVGIATKQNYARTVRRERRIAIHCERFGKLNWCAARTGNLPELAAIARPGNVGNPFSIWRPGGLERRNLSGCNLLRFTGRNIERVEMGHGGESKFFAVRLFDGVVDQADLDAMSLEVVGNESNDVEVRIPADGIEGNETRQEFDRPHGPGRDAGEGAVIRISECGRTFHSQAAFNRL